MRIQVEPLTAARFAPYGRVLGQPSEAAPTIVDAVSDVWLGLSDLMEIGATPGRQITYLAIHTRPARYDRIEKHETSAEAFIPLTGESVLLVLPPGAVNGAGADMSQARAFLMDGRQGVLLYRGAWHAVPYTLSPPSTYLVLVDDAIIARGDLHVIPIEPIEFDLSGLTQAALRPSKEAPDEPA